MRAERPARPDGRALTAAAGGCMMDAESGNQERAGARRGRMR